MKLVGVARQRREQREGRASKERPDGPVSCVREEGGGGRGGGRGGTVKVQTHARSLSTVDCSVPFVHR